MNPLPTAEECLALMTLEEQVSLLSGEDFWSLPAISRLGIGKLRVTDGPNGARGGGSLIGGVKSAAFPVGISIGASWNTALAKEIGEALAQEVKSKGAHVSLAPTVNIHRSVTNGRNFECYSEDAVLTGKLAVGYIQGLQGQGISATIKHFAGNESEIQRTTINSEIDERSLREIYLLPFEMAVKEGGTWGIMSSYNKLNGTYTAENHWLLTEVLRGDWGYDGVVMSDWFGSRSTAPTVNAGLDLEMPGPTRDRGAKLLAAVEAGEVSAKTISERALSVLRLMERTGALNDHRAHEEHAEDRPEHRALVRRAGAEGTVLLKNRDGILPLAKNGHGTIAVIGPNAKVAQIMGGGSAQLNPHYRISPYDGLVGALGGDTRLKFAPGAGNNRFQPMLSGHFKAEYFASRDLSGPVVHTDTMENVQAFLFGAIGGGMVDPAAFSLRLTGSFTPLKSGLHRAGMFATGPCRVSIDGKFVVDGWDWKPGTTFFEEGCEEITGDVMLHAGQAHEVFIEFAAKKSTNLVFSALQAGIGLPLGDEAIAEAVSVASAAETVLVFAGRNGEMDTEGSDLPNIRLPGRQVELIQAVADANPNTIVVLQTGGPVEMPWIDSVAAVLEAWYPGQEAGNAIADVLFGDAEPGGRLPQTFPVKWADNPAHSQDKEIYPGLNGKVRYEEGLFIGYKHYEKTGIAPLFPFGHGLSYTEFEWSQLQVLSSDDDAVIAEIAVTNIGARIGQEVVQLYVEDPAPLLPRPRRELKGFAKLTLKPGETQIARFELKPRDFACFDTEYRGWVARAGRFVLHVNVSAQTLKSSAEVRREKEWRELARKG